MCPIQFNSIWYYHFQRGLLFEIEFLISISYFFLNLHHPFFLSLSIPLSISLSFSLSLSLPLFGALSHTLSQHSPPLPKLPRFLCMSVCLFLLSVYLGWPCYWCFLYDVILFQYAASIHPSIHPSTHPSIHPLFHSPIHYFIPTSIHIGQFGICLFFILPSTNSSMHIHYVE